MNMRIFIKLIKKANAQHRFGNMAGLVLKSSSVFQLNFSAKRKISSSISATSPSREPLCDMLNQQSSKIETPVINGNYTDTNFTNTYFFSLSFVQNNTVDK